jgi:hypothetical protein
MNIAIVTTASTDEVFRDLRSLTSAMPAALARFAGYRAPLVSTRPPNFTIRASGVTGSAPVAWVGKVEATPEGSLIVARTDRSWAAWQSAAALAFLLVFTVINRDTPVRYGNLTSRSLSFSGF